MTKQKRDKRFNMVFFQKEFDNIEKYAEDSNLTISEFIREAIRYKIRSIENPQYYNGIMNQVKNVQTKAEAKHEARTKDIKADQQLIYSKTMEELKKLSKKINGRIPERKRVTQSDIDLISSTIREKAEVGFKELLDITKFDTDKLSNILKDRKQFSINMNGRYKLKRVSKKL